jgi:hypothetical protein
VVLRAWRLDGARSETVEAHRDPPATWALAFGVVLASQSAQGLGRAARWYAADAESAGWTATVLTGPRALSVAIAGDPRSPAPTTAARVVRVEAVVDALNACVAGAGSHVARGADAVGRSPWLDPICQPANSALWTTAERHR